MLVTGGLGKWENIRFAVSNVKILKTCRVELEMELGDGSLEGIKSI